MPYQKELHYFDEKAATPRLTEVAVARPPSRRHSLAAAVEAGGKGPPYGPSPSELRWWADYFLRDTDDEWYLRLFAPAGRGVTGTSLPAMPSWTRHGRARSRACSRRQDHLLPSPSRRTGVVECRHAAQLGSRRGVGDNELRRHFESRGSTSRTAYLEMLDRWSARFSPDRFFVGFFEDIVLRPVELLDEVCTFIGVAQLPVGEGAGDAVHQGRSSAIPARHARHLATLVPAADPGTCRSPGLLCVMVAVLQRATGSTLRRVAGHPVPVRRTEMLRDWMAAEGLPGDAPPVGSGRLDLVRCSNSSDCLRFVSPASQTCRSPCLFASWRQGGAWWGIRWYDDSRLGNRSRDRPRALSGIREGVHRCCKARVPPLPNGTLRVLGYRAPVQPALRHRSRRRAVAGGVVAAAAVAAAGVWLVQRHSTSEHTVTLPSTYGALRMVGYLEGGAQPQTSQQLSFVAKHDSVVIAQPKRMGKIATGSVH